MAVAGHHKVLGFEMADSDDGGSDRASAATAQNGATCAPQDAA